MRARGWLLAVGLLFATVTARAEDIVVHGMAGGVVSLASDAGTGVEPLAWINVDAPVADSDYSPHLLTSVVLSALPGDSLDISSPATFKAVEFSVGLAQPISNLVHFDLYGEVGFATRLPGSPTPRDSTARWASGGIRFRSERGYLSLGVGADQRLTGAYRPAATIRGAVKLWQATDATKMPKGVMMMLVGDAILGLDAPTYGQPHTRDVVRCGVAIGI